MATNSHIHGRTQSFHPPRREADPSHRTRRPNAGRALVFGAAALAGTALLAGPAHNVWRAATHNEEDSRSVEGKAREAALFEALLSSGGAEAQVDGVTIESTVGTITVRQLRSFDASKAPVPIHVRSTPDLQAQTNKLMSEDNTVFEIGSKRPEKGDQSLASATEITFQNPFIVTRADGEQFAGGILVEPGHDAPNIESAQDASKHMVWVDISRIEEGGIYSGAQVDRQPSADTAASIASESVSLHDGRLIGDGTQSLHGDVSVSWPVDTPSI